MAVLTRKKQSQFKAKFENPEGKRISGTYCGSGRPERLSFSMDLIFYYKRGPSTALRTGKDILLFIGNPRLRKNTEMKHTQTTHKSPCAGMFLCCCALMLLCSSASVGALPKTAKLVPPETILLVDIDNFSQLRAQFEKTSLYNLYKDPSMAAFVDDSKTRWREKIQEPDNEFVRIIADAGVLPRGRAAVALVLDEQTKDANEPPILFIAQWGEKTDKVKETVDKMVEKAVENGAHRKTEDYRGVSITTLTGKSSAALSYCFIDDCLIGSMVPDALKFVIAHIKGAGSPTLADDEDYAATMKAVVPSAEGQVNFYVNIKQTIKTLIAEDTTDKIKIIIDNLGIDNVISFGCSIDLTGGPGGSGLGKAILKVDGAKKGLCKMLDIESAAFRTPQFVPPSACSVSFMNWDIKQAYDELANILSSLSPQFAAIMYMPLLPPSPQGEPPLQLKADIIDHLNSQIIISQSINKSSSDADTTVPVEAKSLFAVAINNRSALEKSLSLLHSKAIAPNNPDASRELLGHTIYLIDISPFLPVIGTPPKTPLQAPLEPSTPKIAKLAFTVTDTHLIFASESAVERAIRRLNSSETVSLDSAEWFARAKSNIPSAAGLVVLQNNAALSEHFWSTMRRSKRTDTSKAGETTAKIGIGMGAGSLLPQLIFSQAGYNLFDFGLLPEFDVVRKHFGLSAFYGTSRPDGFFFEYKYLNPAVE
jgi:hypothetical protein